MGKLNAKKQLRRLEKQLNQFREQQTNYNLRIESEERYAEKAEKVRESCLQVKLALEKLNQAGAVLLGGTPGLNFAAQNNDNNSQASESGQSDLLDLLNSPKFRQVANDLLGDLLK